MYEMWRTKYTEPNIQRQIHSIKPTKLNPPNQFYQTKSSLTSLINFMQQILNEVKQSSSSSLSWAWPNTVPACFFLLSVLSLNCWSSQFILLLFNVSITPTNPYICCLFCNCFLLHLLLFYLLDNICHYFFHDCYFFCVTRGGREE